MKNKLTKFTSIGLASLLALSSPIRYASAEKTFSNSTAPNNPIKKLLKLPGVKAGLSALAAWGIICITTNGILSYIDYCDNKQRKAELQRHKEQEVEEEERRKAEEERIRSKIDNFLCVPIYDKICKDTSYNYIKRQKIIDVINKLSDILECDSLSETGIGDLNYSILTFNGGYFDRKLMAILCQSLIHGYLYGGTRNSDPHFVCFLPGDSVTASLNLAISVLAFAQTNKDKLDEKRIQKVTRCIKVLHDELKPIINLLDRKFDAPDLYAIPNFYNSMLGLTKIAVNEEEFNWQVLFSSHYQYVRIFYNFLKFVGELYLDLINRGYSDEELANSRLITKETFQLYYGRTYLQGCERKHVTLKKYLECLSNDDNHYSWVDIHNENRIKTIEISLKIRNQIIRYNFKCTRDGYL